MVGECGKIFFHEIEIERDDVSDDYGVFSEEIFYLRQNSFSCRSAFEVSDRKSGDESDDVFQLIGFFVRLDQGLICADDFSCRINLHDPYLDRLIFADV